MDSWSYTMYQEYTKPLALAIKEHKTMMNFDGFLYIIGSIPMFVATLVLLFLNFVMYAGQGMTKCRVNFKYFEICNTNIPFTNRNSSFNYVVR